MEVSAEMGGGDAGKKEGEVGDETATLFRATEWVHRQDGEGQKGGALATAQRRAVRRRSKARRNRR